MLAFLNNLGPLELVLIAVVAVLVFGKNLPEAASKAYMQARKLRNALDDLRRESGIESEIQNIQRSVREAEWEARRVELEARTIEAPHPRAPEPRAPAPPEAPDAPVRDEPKA